MTNFYLRYSVEVLLHEANPNNEVLGQTAFYKLLVELYHRLKGKNIDIQLPYFWYRYGTMLESRSFMAQTGTDLLYYAPYKAHTRNIEIVSDYSIPVNEKEIIYNEVKKLLGEYSQNDYLNIHIPSRLLNDNYKRAPLIFGKTFNRDFFEYIKELGINRLAFSRDEYAIIEEYLDTLMKQYPRREIPELFNEYLKWDDTIRMVFELSDGCYYKMIEDFWFTYCLILRTKYYENVLPEVITKWERDFFDFSLPEYSSRLDSEREKILTIYSGYQTNDEEINYIVDKAMLISRNSLINGK